MTDCDRALELISAGLDWALTPRRMTGWKSIWSTARHAGRWTPTLRPCTSSSPPWHPSPRRS